MAKRDQPAAQMMRANAGLHADQAGRQISEAVLKLAARKLGPQDDDAALVEANQVKDILADIDADDGNLGTGFGGFAVGWHGQLLCSGYPLCKRWEEPPVHPISGRFAGAPTSERVGHFRKKIDWFC